MVNTYEILKIKTCELCNIILYVRVEKVYQNTIYGGLVVTLPYFSLRKKFYEK